MDAGMILVLREVLKLSASAYINYMRLGGKTEDEIKIEFGREVEKALAFKVSDIKDV